jgi:peptide/nickel transport system permease protein
MTTQLTDRLDASLTARPEMTRARKVRAAWRLRTRNPSAAIGIFLVASLSLVALFAHVIAPVDPWTSVSTPFSPPSLDHPFGTDDLGRDLFSGVVHGARSSLLVGLTVAALSASIGIFLGAAAGFFSGWLDDGVMRLTEFFQVMPRFFLALVVIALFKPGLVTITLVLGLTSWALTTRLLRAQVLSAREREYVVAVKALGGNSFYVLWKHVLPHALPPVIVHSALMVGQAMLAEAGLAFLGLGDPNHISWGYLLKNAQPFLRTAWWLPVFPGLALTLAVMAFNLASDGLGSLPAASQRQIKKEASRGR